MLRSLSSEPQVIFKETNSKLGNPCKFFSPVSRLVRLFVSKITFILQIIRLPTGFCLLVTIEKQSGPQVDSVQWSASQRARLDPWPVRRWDIGALEMEPHPEGGRGVRTGPDCLRPSSHLPSNELPTSRGPFSHTSCPRAFLWSLQLRST